MRRTIAEYGAKRAKVRVFVEGDLVRVQWRVSGRLLTKSYPLSMANRATAKAFAKGVADARERPREKVSVTIRELWERFAESEFPHLRAKTKKLYREYYARWEAMWTPHFMAERTTVVMMQQFRADLTRRIKLKTSTIRQTIQTVKMVYAWGEENELLEVNKIHRYRFRVSRDEPIGSPAEYSAPETEKILAALDEHSATQWRPKVALLICANQGVRQNAVLHLQWADVDEEGDVITWRSKWDKMGNEWTQPIRVATREALAIARAWRKETGYEGPWVIPSGSSKNAGDVYTIQSLWAALKSAQTRSGVTNIPLRAGHGLRRKVMGDVNAATGDAALALQSIGDTDIRQANRYLKKRDERVLAAFTKLDNPPETK